MSTYVLVHGGGHGGWCFRKVARLLREAGHEVHTPTLTGLGERAHLLSAETDLHTHIADVVNLFFYEDLHDVVLVGHSYGGIVITQAGNTPEVQALVYVAALAPDANEKISDLRARFAPATNNVVRSADGFLTLDPATFHDDFAADLPEADAAFMARS